MDQRACTTCKSTLPIADFATPKSYYCKPCWSDYCRARHARMNTPEYRAQQSVKMREWRAANPGHARKTGKQKQRRIRRAPLPPLSPTKPCSECGIEKPRAEFGTLKNGWRSRCDPCHAAIARVRHGQRKADPEYKAKNASRARDWSKENPDGQRQRREADPEKYAAIRRKSRTGWTRQQFDAAWEKQGARCVICAMVLKKCGLGPNVAHADHDHDARRPRGLLCGNCNRGLGAFKDSPDLLLAAATYLIDHADAPAVG